MLEVTMTAEDADSYCTVSVFGKRHQRIPCLGSERDAEWGCGDDECILCCEAHRQGRGDAE